jgi:hypothetical protein
MDALIGGLLALPEFRTTPGDSIWTYLALLNAANHRGVVCKRSDQIAVTLKTDEAMVLADLDKLSEVGLIRTLNPAPYLVIQLALWPGKSAAPDADVPIESGQQPVAHEEAPVSSGSAAAAASASPSEDGGRGEGDRLLDHVLAVLGSEADPGEMRDLLMDRAPEIVERALQRVESTPARQIRRSKTALFRFLLTKLTTDTLGHE